MKHTHYTARNGDKIASKLSSEAYRVYASIDPLDIHASSDDPSEAIIDVTGGNAATGLTFERLEKFLIDLSEEFLDD